MAALFIYQEISLPGEGGLPTHSGDLSCFLGPGTRSTGGCWAREFFVNRLTWILAGEDRPYPWLRRWRWDKALHHRGTAAGPVESPKERRGAEHSQRKAQRPVRTPFYFFSSSTHRRFIKKQRNKEVGRPDGRRVRWPSRPQANCEHRSLRVSVLRARRCLVKPHNDQGMYSQYYLHFILVEPEAQRR